MRIHIGTCVLSFKKKKCGKTQNGEPLLFFPGIGGNLEGVREEIIDFFKCF